tara:strand:+ start:829 stop:1662 length:834 start_codon:yes stop_codon:yes gene_type:complete
MKSEKKKYLIVLLITTGIFVVVFGLVNMINANRLANIDDLQRQITADLIATETQFDLLKTAPCNSIENTILSKELNELGRKLDFTQDSQGADDPDVVQLKKYYSLLQVKDYLLMEEFAGKCGIDISSILYFYNGNCKDCARQALVLNEFKRQYPDVRIYSFDANLDFSVIETFISLYDFGQVYPTLIIKDEAYQGLQGLEKLNELFPELVEQKIQQEQVESIQSFIIEELDIEEQPQLDKISDEEFMFTLGDGRSGVLRVTEGGSFEIEFDETKNTN